MSPLRYILCSKPLRQSISNEPRYQELSSLATEEVFSKGPETILNRPALQGGRHPCIGALFQDFAGGYQKSSYRYYL